MATRTLTTTFTGRSHRLGGGDGKEDKDEKQEDKKNSSGPSNGPNIEEKNAPITANEEAMQIKVEDKNLEDKKKKIVEKDVKTDGEEDEDKKLEVKKKNDSGSNNTFFGIGALHGNNNIKGSFNELTTLNLGKP